MAEKGSTAEAIGALQPIAGVPVAWLMMFGALNYAKGNYQTSAEDFMYMSGFLIVYEILGLLRKKNKA